MPRHLVGAAFAEALTAIGEATRPDTAGHVQEEAGQQPDTTGSTSDDNTSERCPRRPGGAPLMIPGTARTALAKMAAALRPVVQVMARQVVDAVAAGGPAAATASRCLLVD